jgi:hypothetical protein
MKTFYYTIKKSGFAWDELSQDSIEFSTWEDFANFCNKISNLLNVEIRGCSSLGYNNQGSYFYNVASSSECLKDENENLIENAKICWNNRKLLEASKLIRYAFPHFTLQMAHLYCRRNFK